MKVGDLVAISKLAECEGPGNCVCWYCVHDDSSCMGLVMKRIEMRNKTWWAIMFDIGEYTLMETSVDMVSEIP